MAKCPSEFQLVQYMADDLPEAVKTELDSHVAQCDLCQKRIEGVQGEMAPFEAKWERHGEELRARLQEEMGASSLSSRRRAVPWRNIGVAVAATIALVVVWSTLRTPTSDEYAQFRSSGTVALEAVAKRGEQVFSVQSDTILTAGDALRFWVVLERPGWISLFSIDAAGTVTPIHPESAAREDGRPLRMPRAGRHSLPDSFVLDDVYGEEMFVLLYSEDQFNRARLHQDVYSYLQTAKGLWALILACKSTC